MNMLMNGVNPVGMVYNQSAENIAYDSNNSVKDMLDDLDTFDLLGTFDTGFVDVNLAHSISDYRKVMVTSYYSNGTNKFALATTITPTSEIANGDRRIVCMNDGTVRKLQLYIISSSKVNVAGFDGVTYGKMWGIR